ncbi:MAG: holo-ACP synthase [Holosporales bacterium]|nr:holo-ACP synthase [Holosporales bacterium]
MIIGIGIDILAISRVGRLLAKFPERFRTKVFTKAEALFCDARVESVSSYAKMFALKEATIKAISCTKGMHWHDMEVTHDHNGRPLINLHGGALRNVLKRAARFSVLATVSDEKDHVSACVIIEGE